MQRWIPGGGLAIAALLLCASTACGTDEAETAVDASTAARAEAIRNQRREIADKIKALSGPETPAREQASGSTHAATEGKSPGDAPAAAESAKPGALASLRALDGLLLQHEALLDQRRQLETELKQAEHATKALDDFGPDEPKPYSFLLLDDLEDRLSVEKDREDALKSDVKLAERLLTSAHEELNTAAGAQNKSPGKPAAAVGKPSATGTSTAVSTADLPLAGPREKVRLKQLAVEVQKLKLDVCRATQKELGKKIDLIKKDVAFSPQDRQRQSERLDDKEAQLRRHRQQVQSQLQSADAQQAAELERLAAKDSPRRVIDAAQGAWRTAVDSYQAEVLLLDQQLEVLSEIRKFWKRRYELATRQIEPDKLAHWRDDAEELVDQWDGAAHSLEHRRDSVNADLAAAASQDSQDADRALAHWVRFRADSLKDLRDLIEERLADIQANQRALGRFRDELKAKLSALPAAGPDSLGALVRSMLGYKVVGNDEQSVTIGRVLLLLAYVIVGILTANFLSRVIGRRLLLWLGMHRGTADAINTIGFYALCIFFGVLAFQMLQIPLAAFAFLGGAAAIAVGFGGQDIMNNFMSGIILLTEQPIRVGDVVELSHVQGVVQHIGLRSTRIRTQTNHELIVPNKNLLDEQVTNLTLSDNFVMATVTVCLDRAVAVTPAMLQMHEAVFLHPMVLKSPRPVVLLKEFDPYWSTFEVCFWLEYASYMKCATVQSQVLEAISALFPGEESTGSSGSAAGEESASEEPAAEPATAEPTASEAGSADAANSAARAVNTAVGGLTLSEVNRKSAAAAVRQVKRAANSARTKS